LISFNQKNYIFQKIIIFSFFSVLIKLSNFLILLLPAFIFFRQEIKIFSKFLNEEYDTDDLIFFLFVRSCIEKEMKIMFLNLFNFYHSFFKI
jgi:hypothetical protein